MQEVAAFDESDCKIAELSIAEKKTEPKKEFSLDTLLSFMEKPRDTEDEQPRGRAWLCHAVSDFFKTKKSVVA